MPRPDPFAAAFELAALRARPADERQRARDLSYITLSYGAAHRHFNKVPEPPARIIGNIRTLGAREVLPPLPPPPKRDPLANAGLSGNDSPAEPKEAWSDRRSVPAPLYTRRGFQTATGFHRRAAIVWL